jgi:hypothetical protein
MYLTDALKMFSASARTVKRSKTRGKRNSGVTVSPIRSWTYRVLAILVAISIEEDSQAGEVILTTKHRTCT